jgi:phage repressor protein C with HTH and peptisase S24 domain
MDIYEYRRKRLAALIKDRYQFRKNIADASGWSEARISQVLSPTHRDGRAFSEKVARKLEADLGLESMYFDQGAVPMAVDASRTTSGANIPQVIFVPLCEISVREEDGETQAVEVVNSGNQFAPYIAPWLAAMGIPSDRAALFMASDDSMEPKFSAGDVVLANCDETDVEDGRMYVIRYGRAMRIRYLSRRLDGALTLRSINPRYPDEHLTAELSEQHISVVGRVREIKVSSEL